MLHLLDVGSKLAYKNRVGLNPPNCEGAFLWRYMTFDETSDLTGNATFQCGLTLDTIMSQRTGYTGYYVSILSNTSAHICRQRERLKCVI